MTTLSDIIEETRHILYSGRIPETNWLASSITSGATSFALVNGVGSAATAGAVIAIDLEEIQVISTSGSTINNCIRGANGTTAAAHSANASVEVIPQFSRFRIMQAVNEDLDDLSSPMNGLFQVKTVDVTFNPVLRGYDLTGVTASDVIAVQEVRYKQPNATHYWPKIRDCRLSRNMAASEFPSTLALFLYEDIGFPGLPMHVRYRAPFTHFANLTDDAQTVAGLPATGNDLPALGAAIRIVEAREIQRNLLTAQRDPMLMETVPPGSVLKSYEGLAMRRQARVVAEAARLDRQYGAPIAA